MLTRLGILEILQSYRKGEESLETIHFSCTVLPGFSEVETIAAGHEFDTLQRIVLVVIYGRCG